MINLIAAVALTFSWDLPPKQTDDGDVNVIDYCEITEPAQPNFETIIIPDVWAMISVDAGSKQYDGTTRVFRITCFNKKGSAYQESTYLDVPKSVPVFGSFTVE